jgi:hypothetical protein
VIRAEIYPASKGYDITLQCGGSRGLAVHKFLLLALAVELNPMMTLAEPATIVAAENFYGDVAKQPRL